MSRSGDLANWLARCLGRGERAPLGPQDAVELADTFIATSYAGGTCIFREGEVLTRVYVVREGTVELSRTVGNRRTAFQVLRSGDVFGDVPVLTGASAPFDACASKDSVILSIEAARLFALFARRPGLAHRWLVSLAGRMGGLQSRIEELLAGSLEARIASVLLHASDPDHVVMSQAALAGLVGARRTSVNQVLKRLEARGIVELAYRHISVIDRDALAAIASHSRDLLAS